jgi:hypothetical protein
MTFALRRVAMSHKNSIIDVVHRLPSAEAVKPPVSADDMDRLLRLAECLGEKCEKSKARLMWLFHYTTGLGGALLTAAGIIWGFLDGEAPLKMAIVGGLLGSTSAVASVGVAYWWHVRGQKARDQRALNEIMDLLRGCAAGMVRREDLSSAAQTMFRVRLARLGIGPEGGPAHLNLLWGLASWWYRGRD